MGISDDSQLTLKNCDVYLEGAAIFIMKNASLKVDNCRFFNNPVELSSLHTNEDEYYCALRVYKTAQSITVSNSSFNGFNAAIMFSDNYGDPEKENTDLVSVNVTNSVFRRDT